MFKKRVELILKELEEADSEPEEPQQKPVSVSFLRYIVWFKILEVKLFAFAYRLFHEDFSPLDGQSVGKCK